MCRRPIPSARKERRIRRRIRHLPPRSVLLVEDETDLLLFPPLRANWSRRGDPQAAQYVDGSAFHLYEGKPVAMSTLNRESFQTDYRADDYIYGQFMKFIQPGAVRIATSGSTQLPPNVASTNPVGSFVLVAANPRTEPRDLSIAFNGKVVTMTLAEKPVVTLTWRR